ncbi:MAG TPA: hypothetical protein VN578_09520 [Candidatus Binatia bacterium]|jgi:hypothetical protein|nr:hypothetical protein [Candidatus Binatia bacterium]
MRTELAVGFSGGSGLRRPAVVALLNPSADRASVDLIAPFFAAMYVVLAVWVGLGLLVFGGTVTKLRMWPLLNAEPIR